MNRSMKFFLISVAAILLFSNAKGQNMPDTVFYFRSNGALTVSDSAVTYVDVHKSSENFYAIQYYNKNKKNEWEKEENSIVYSLQQNILKEERYVKKKRVSVEEISWNKSNGSLYKFQDQSGVYYSRYPIPLVKDSVFMIFYGNTNLKNIVCQYKDNLCNTCNLFNRSGKVIAEDIMIQPEILPKYDGRDLEYYREVIQKTLIYPRTAIENGIFGRMYVQFVVKSDGTVGAINILRSVDPLLDEACINAIKEVKPLWKPGYNNGKPVSVVMVMPVIFMLK